MKKQLKAAVALLLAGFVLAGCYNPKSDAPVGGYAGAQTGAPGATNPELAPVYTQPVPTSPTPASTSPMLRVGDMVTVEWFDTPTLIPQYKERIRDDGKLILPLNVTVQAAGRTVAQLQDDIRNAYVPKYYNHLTPSVKTDERVYFVGGEVRVPNRQFFQEGITVLRAIDTAGGFTDFANRSRIELRRENGKSVSVNWKKAMKDPKLDPVVYPNDQIIVHKRSF
ncbi:MAG TPA: polysaccharide biosynthesis/export family protein [Verrucomicrobiae bacterium]|nr:polysaccharide biosynthesis/export family protein [Verrucomicrobiae bacterium]